MKTHKPNVLTKGDIASHVRRNFKVSFYAGRSIAQAMVDILIQAIEDKQTINLTGLGKLSPNIKGERLGRNPKTGEPHTIEPRLVYTLTNRSNASEGKFQTNDFATALASRCALTQPQAKRLYKDFVKAIKQTVMDGGKVELRGLGKFYGREIGSYLGRNPKTGEAVTVPTRLRIRFKLSTCLHSPSIFDK